VNPLGSVAGRLALGLLFVVTGVLGIVYLIVVPSYRASLENTELRRLEAAMQSDAVPNYPLETYLQQPYASALAQRINARVVVYGLLSNAPVLLEPAADSNLEGSSADTENDPVALDVLAHLDDYLVQFEAAVQRAGGHVHWARDAAEANAVVAEAARRLGAGLSGLANIFEPDVIVLGGGVTKAVGELMIGPARDELRSRALPPMNEVPVELAELGTEAGMVGAAEMARLELEQGG